MKILFPNIPSGFYLMHISKQLLRDVTKLPREGPPSLAIKEGGGKKVFTLLLYIQVVSPHSRAAPTLDGRFPRPTRLQGTRLLLLLIWFHFRNCRLPNSERVRAAASKRVRPIRKL